MLFLCLTSQTGIPGGLQKGSHLLHWKRSCPGPVGERELVPGWVWLILWERLELGFTDCEELGLVSITVQSRGGLGPGCKGLSKRDT